LRHPDSVYRDCRFSFENPPDTANPLHSYLKPKLNPAIGLEFCASPFRPPALQVHCDWIARDMCPCRLNVHRERSCIATEALGADARLIYRFEQLFFQCRHLRIRIFGAEWARRRFLCERHAKIG
jgi:hypothetical protein